MDTPIPPPTTTPITPAPPMAQAPAAVPPPTALGNIPPHPPSPKITMPIIVAIITTAVIVSVLFFGISRLKSNNTPVAPTPTSTPNPTPTPIRQPSAIATESAFIDFQTMVATLSAAIKGFDAQDPSLTPPTLVLPLGFSR